MTVGMEPRVTVPDADDMDDEIFAKHMSLRHGDSLGGMPELDPELIDDYVMRCWRAFHRRLHEIRHDLNHEHRGYR